jgi:hypothetical protein
MTVNNATSSTTLDLSLVCVQINSKWYIYDGMTETTSENISNEAFVMNQQSTESQTEDSSASGAAADADEAASSSEANDNLEFTSDAIKKLRKGNVTIDDVAYVMPVNYKDFGAVLTLRTDLIKDEDRMIESNQILKNLPCAFSNKDYEDVQYTVDIANPSTKKKDVEEGIVSTLMIHRSTDSSTPKVVLPGNVTFGTTKANVKKMYGTPDTKSSKGDSDDFYAYNLNNEHNTITFTFTNDEVSEIKWYYYDIADFR